MSTTLRRPPGHPLDPGDAQRLGVDDLVPSSVMRPSDAEDAARSLRLCSDAGAAVVVVGGGTQLRLGAPPRRYDVAFSTERLSRIIEYEPADLTCRVDAGLPIGQLQAKLAQEGQWLPLEPAHPDRATVGGVVAANTSGPGRARYGTVRDWVIGIAVAYPNGTVARAGGKVVKNVAGYDLMKLHTGALGTLGVIVEVNLKIQARPEATRGLLARFDDHAAAIRCALGLSRDYLQPAVTALVDRRAWQAIASADDGKALLAMRLDGYRAEVDAAADHIATQVRSDGGRLEPLDDPAVFDRIRDWPAPQDDAAIVFSASVPRTGFLELIAATEGEASIVALPAAGVAHFRPLNADPASVLARLRQAAGAMGQVVLASALPDFKHRVDVWGDPPPGFPLMRALKASLDPQGILNPGRFVGGI